MDCLFCKIIKKEIVSQLVYEDADLMAIKDINPQAPVHLLIIPKKHIATLNDLTEKDASLQGKLLSTATKLAREMGIHEKGYRTVINCNREGGQSVYHLHLHLLGGRQLGGSMVG